MSTRSDFDAIAAALSPSGGVDWQALGGTVIAPLLIKMEQTPQNPLHHREGNVLQHTVLACEALVALPEYRAASERERLMLLLAVLLHDIGKTRTTREEQGVAVSPGHTRVGAIMARELLWLAGLCGRKEDQTLREAVCTLIRYHSLPPYAMKEQGIERRLRQIAAQGELAPDFTLRHLCTLERADVLGRISSDREEHLDRVEYCALLSEELGCLDRPYPFPDGFSARAYFRGKSEWAEQKHFDDSTCEVIMLSGLPATGKDTWIASSCPDLPTVSLDGIRARLGISPTEDQGRVIAAATEECRAHLRAGESFVYNATSLTAQLRHKWVNLFEGYGASVRTVFLECPLGEELSRNAGRTGSAVVPERAIFNMLSKLEMPERYETCSVEWLMT